MFDYSTLVGQVRRLLGDELQYAVEDSTMQNTSYYISLSEEGSINILSFTIDEEDIDSSRYILRGNIIKMNEQIESGSAVSIEYNYSKYSDEKIVEYIGDTIDSYIQPLINRDFGFSGTETNSNISYNESSLFVHGTVLNILGIDVISASGDTVRIKDGDTMISTDVAAKQAGDTYKIILNKFLYLLKTVRVNTFQGVVKEE